MKINKIIKATVITILMVWLNAANGFGQVDAIDRFFKNYMEDPDFTTIYISGKMFGMMSQIPNEKEDELIKKQLRDLQGLRILTSDKVNGTRLYDEVFSTLDKNGYEDLMIVREGNEEFRFLIKEKEGVISELLMLSGQDDEFLLLSLYGIIDLRTISKLSEGSDIGPLDKLKNLDNNDSK